MPLESLSQYDVISFSVSSLALLAVLISLVYQRRQTQEMAKSLKATAFLEVASQMLTVDELFIRQPTLRPYFYTGRELTESDPDTDQVLATAEYLLDFFGYILVQSQHFSSIQMFPSNWWPTYIRDMFASSPVLCRYLTEVQEWYNPDLLKLMSEAKARQRVHPA
jgi:hypothetical protein